MKPIQAIVTPLAKPPPPKPLPPPLKVSGVRAVIKGPNYDELMRWRRGQLTTKEGQKLTAYRKIFLGEPEYQVNNKPFPADQVHSFRRDEYICQPNQTYDPQAYLP